MFRITINSAKGNNYEHCEQVNWLKGILYVSQIALRQKEVGRGHPLLENLKSLVYNEGVFERCDVFSNYSRCIDRIHNHSWLNLSS